MLRLQHQSSEKRGENCCFGQGFSAAPWDATRLPRKRQPYHGPGRSVHKLLHGPLCIWHPALKKKVSLLPHILKTIPRPPPSNPTPRVSTLPPFLPPPFHPPPPPPREKHMCGRWPQVTSLPPSGIGSTEVQTTAWVSCMMMKHQTLHH